MSFTLRISPFVIAEIARIQSGGKPPGRESKFVDVYHEKPVRLSVRAVVPVKEHPKVKVIESEIYNSTRFPYFFTCGNVQYL